MAFEDGLNRRVTIARRERASETEYADEASLVECRIWPLKAEQIQELSQVVSERVSHGLLAGPEEDIRDGDRLTVTETRGLGGAWQAPTGDADVFYVVLAQLADGASSGPHHLRAGLTRSVPT